jgi:hypothetical protein
MNKETAKEMQEYLGTRIVGILAENEEWKKDRVLTEKEIKHEIQKNLFYIENLKKEINFLRLF